MIDEAALAAFDLVPTPVSIFDRSTLRFLAVNRATAEDLGRSVADLLEMTISELGSPQDEWAARRVLAEFSELGAGAGRWHLRKASGGLVEVSSRWRAVSFRGQDAVLATWHDVSAFESEGGRETTMPPEYARATGDPIRLESALVQEQAARLRTAERLLNLGTWTLDMTTSGLEWSDRVRELYGVPADQPVPDFDAYLDLVHPDDREAVIATYRAFEETGAAHITFQHRILRPDGRMVHVKGVGERHRVAGGDRIVGFVQDVTESVASMERLSQATDLMKMAGERAKLGGWRVDLDSDRIQWTEETAAIHEEPPGTQPTVEEGIAYYSPEAREVMSARFDACARRGEDFDEVLRLVTARGRLIWVRAMGEPVRDPQGAIVAVQGAFQDITEIVEARRQFAAVSRLLRETLENMGDAFFVIDDDWRFTFVNRQAELVLGRAPRELIGRSIWTAFPEAVESTFQTEYERVRTEGRTARFVEFYPPLGKWFRVSAYPAPDGIAVYFNDVTEERAREQQLRLLESAVSRLNDIIMITEASPIDAPAGPAVVYVNEAIERHAGYSPAEIIGRTPRILQGPATDRAELDRIRSALEEGRPIRSEILNYTRAGEPYWLELDIVPLADEAGSVSHFVAVERNITERKEAQEAIRIRDERFQLLSKATNDLVWDWDIETDAVWCNERFFTQFGHPAGMVDQGFQAWRDHIHPDDRDGIVQRIGEAIAGTETSWSGEYRFFRADGTVRRVVDRGFIIRDEVGRGVRMLGSMFDVTEHRDLQARYLQAQKLEAVGQLTGGVAHDFNNLLTIILGNSEMLLDELTDPAQRSLAEVAVMAAERGADLIARLLAFSRRQVLAPRRLDLIRQVREMEELLRRTLRADIHLQLLSASDLWAVDADPAQLESALLNLVLNARDAMPTGGRLTIETTNVSFDEPDAMRQDEVRPGPYVMISVSDTGHGMPPDVVACAFEPFFTTKEVGAGSGLGLSMVYGFAKQSGGHVSIYSELGYGTTVKLYLPRSAEDSALFEAGPTPDAIRGGTERILVVEDDDRVREQLVAQLHSLGYLVESAANGPEAMELLGREGARYDLLLTDVIMPGGMNGRDLAEAALAEHPDLRVLFTSGYTENAIIHHGRLDEGVHLLAKPYRRQELAEKVRLVLIAGIEGS